MTTPDQIQHGIQCIRSVKENVGNLPSRRHALLAKSLIVMHKANPVFASRIAEVMRAKTDAELKMIEMQTVAQLGNGT